MADDYGLDRIKENAEEMVGKQKKKSYTISPKKEPVKNSKMVEILDKRDKMSYEINIKVDDKDARISRINADLFGVGKENDKNWKSKIGELETELNNPSTKGHPVVQRMRDVINQVQLLQIEYLELIHLLKERVEDYDQLLYDSYQLYKKRVNELKTMPLPPKPEEKKEDAKPSKSKQLAEEFMLKHGGIELLKEYKSAYDDDDIVAYTTTKERFLSKAQEFLQGKVSDTIEAANKIFDYYAKNNTQTTEKSAA